MGRRLSKCYKASLDEDRHRVCSVPDNLQETVLREAVNVANPESVIMPALRAAAPPNRTADQLWEHYQIEKQLAAKLRNASRTERRKLYSEAYDELFRRVPHHPQLARKVSSAERARNVQEQLGLLRRFLTPDSCFLEIGAGDCALSLHLAERVHQVYALDVSETISRESRVPANFRLILSDGVSVPVPPGSVTVAYSNQLMEHLHPEDAAEQLANIVNGIATGGVYVCVTPNLLTGPHDVSRSFDDTATGFHLKEYTNTELRRIFRNAGFRRTVQYARLRSGYFRIPAWVTYVIERGLDALSPSLRKRLCRNRLARSVLGIWMVGWK
jgi:SAM-dependent methyltransferase